MKVKICEDKLNAVCEKCGKQYEIHHQSKDGKDITSLAKIASKSGWFTVDNPQFTPGSIQEASPMSNGRILVHRTKP